MDEQKQTEIKQKFKLGLGGLHDPIKKQLKQQHLKFAAEDINYLQTLADGLFELHISGFMHDIVHGKIKIKIYNAVVRHVEKKNKGIKIQKLKYVK